MLVSDPSKDEMDIFPTDYLLGSARIYPHHIILAGNGGSWRAIIMGVVR
jgi:hypothetical protein